MSVKYPILARSNGHEWIKPKFIGYQYCKNCGIIRRSDDKNSPCKGVVGIVLKEQGEGAT